jgi:hypothetical protein
MTNLVFGIATSRPQADQVLDGLKTAGFVTDALSALFPERGDALDSARERTSRKQRKESSPAMPRPAWWAARRHSFASVGACNIPGIGSVIAAGPIIAVLREAAAEGMARALVGLGVSGDQANRYEVKIRDGSILISVQTHDSDETARANEIFMVAGAQDICLPSETSTKDMAATEYASRPTEASHSRTRL